MADLFKLLGGLGILLSVVVGVFVGYSGGSYGAAVALIYAVGGVLSSLMLLAIGGALARLDAIVRNTAPATATNGPATAAFKWKARE